MAGYTEQHLIDALVSSMVDNSSYAVLAGEDMPLVMRQEMESSMSRLAEPIHDHIVSWATDSGSGGPPYEYNLGNPPFDGYILASTSAGVRYWTPPGTGGVVNETDPVFLASVAYGITASHISNWDTAYGWGNHAGLYSLVTHDHDTRYYTQTYLDSLFELVGTAPNQYIRCKYPFAGDYDIQGYTDFGQFPPTIWESMPLATSSTIGGIQLGVGGTRFLREDGTWQTVSTGSEMIYPAGSGIPIVVSGTSWGTTITDNSANWNTAYGWGNHALAGYLTSQTSHADVVVDGDFTSQGIMLRGATSGSYSILTDNSTNWNTAYGWGNHAGLYRPVAWVPTWDDVTSKPTTFTPINHGLVSSYHTVSGLTTGHFLRATGSTTFGFAALAGTDVKPLLSDWFELVGTAPNQYIRCKYPFAGDYDIQGYTDFGQFPPTIWESMPLATTLAIGGIQLNGSTTQYLRGDGTWATPPSGSGMVYPAGSGIPIVVSGTSWGTTITNNSTNWNTAYGWGNHAGLYSLVSHTHTGMVDYTGTPVNNQVAVFTDTNTIEGHTGFTYDSTTGYVNVAGIVRASGSLQHLTLQAGNASGAAGTDAGNITIKAGDAINADSASVAGALYLVPGNLYATGGSGIIYLGDSTNINTRVSFRTIGTPTNISIEFIPKGDGGVILGGYTTYIMGALSMGESIQINEGYRLLTPEILGRNGTGPLTIRAPGGYSGSPNGRDLMLYPGLAYTGGVNGNIYLGTGSAGYLPAKVSETDIIYYDSTTGKISYGAAPTSGTNYWQRVGTLLSPATAGDDLEIDGDVWLNAAVYITSQFLDTPLGYMLENNNSNRLAIGTGLNFMVITYANRHKVPGVAASTHPTLSVWSNADPEINANQYIAMTHNGTEGVIWSATGLVKIDDGLIVTGSMALTGISSATTSYVLYYNNTTGVITYGAAPSGSSPVDSTLLDWSTDRYQPYAAAATGAFDSGAVNPSGTTRLNYGGYLYATRLYSGGEQTITLSAAVNANRLAVYSGPTSVSSLATLYMVGDVLNAGYLYLGAATTTYPSLRIPHGTAPTTPTNGDMWTTTSGIYVRINGTTVGPLGTGITGSGSSGRVTYWSGTSAVTSSANLIFDGSILTISNGIRLTAPATNQTGSGIRSSFTAGEALVFGNLVYMKSDGKVWKAAASSITTTPVMGMCMGTVSAEGSADILLSGRVYNSSWSLGTGGNVLYLGTSAGGFSSVAPSGVTGYVVQVIGVVLSATTIYFNPSLNRITLA